MPRPAPSGSHELGQNMLVDPRARRRVVDAVASTRGPILEMAAGDGALTLPLARLGRPVVAVEVDARLLGRLRARAPAGVRVVEGDLLTLDPPPGPHVVVGNLPFHLTTAVLRRLLGLPGWTDAVLLVQWEVARRRAGVGGATMMTAQWWPWFEFGLLGRIPATAFRPVPSVDGGLLRVARRPAPLVAERAAYQRFVRRVFTSPGRGVPDIVRRTGRLGREEVARWAGGNGVGARTRPRDLDAAQWTSLWAAVRPVSPGSAATRTAGTGSRCRGRS